MTRWSDLRLQPLRTNSAASQSSSSECDGVAPLRPRFSGVATIPVPKCCCQTRLACTRASSPAAREPGAREPAARKQAAADLPRVEVASRAELRRWFGAHHASSRGAWIVTRKRTAGGAVAWNDVVEEALCVGWIDSLPRKLDEGRSMLLVTPRKPTSRWSAKNQAHVADLEARGLMRPAGREAVALHQALGRVSAELIAPYPPGIPVLAPGEVVTDNTVAALESATAAGVRIAYAADPTLTTIGVVSA